MCLRHNYKIFNALSTFLNFCLLYADRCPDREDDVTNWTETQMHEWERSSWSSDRDNRVRERGRQTPFAFQEHAEEAESVAEDRQTDEQGVNRYLIRTIINRLDSQREEIYNKLNDQHAVIYNKLNEQQAAICTKLAAYFNEIHIRMNRQDNEIREIKEVLYQQHQASRYDSMVCKHVYLRIL